MAIPLFSFYVLKRIWNQETDTVLIKYILSSGIKVTKKPHISVVIPTYNHAPLLKRALASVCSQTFQNWEAIVINNYSNDDTLSVVASFNDKRIIVENFDNKGVIGAARNVGIRMAKADFISFLDSDDEWFPKKLEIVKKSIGQGDLIICHGELWVRNGVKFKTSFYGPAGRASYKALLYRGNCLSTSAVTVNKKVLEQVGCFSIEPKFSMVEDYDLWMRLASAGFEFSFINEVLGVYNIHGNNSSSAILKHLRAELYLLKDHFAREPQKNLKDRMLMLSRILKTYLSHGFNLLKK